MPREPRRRPGGRPTIFGSREGGSTVHGRITAFSTARLGQAKAALAVIAGWEPEQISDSDALEYLLRGDKAARHFLADNPPPAPPTSK